MSCGRFPLPVDERASCNSRSCCFSDVKDVLLQILGISTVRLFSRTWTIALCTLFHHVDNRPFRDIRTRIVRVFGPAAPASRHGCLSGQALATVKCTAALVMRNRERGMHALKHRRPFSSEHPWMQSFLCRSISQLHLCVLHPMLGFRRRTTRPPSCHGAVKS
jgi:hypothetical protein